MFVTTYYLLPPDEGVMSSTTLDFHFSENRAVVAANTKAALLKGGIVISVKHASPAHDTVRSLLPQAKTVLISNLNKAHEPF